MRNLTPNQSHYVLGTLISQGRVRPALVHSVLLGREREIRSLRERLAALENLEGGSVGRAGSRRPRGRKRAAPRGRRKMSPQVRALRRLQGKYMGFVRRLRPAEKARVRSVREKQGIGPAIRLAASLGSRS